MIADMMEKLKVAAPVESVECDFCTGRKQNAVSSCLVCLASYCEAHLLPHYESPAFKKHKLVKASRRLQEQICPQHGKLLEVYCRTDQQCICMLCTMDDHKGHEILSAAAERAERQESMNPPSFRKLGLRAILQHDNDPKHTSKTTTALLKKLRVKVLGWVSMSPDLNPIERLWGTLKRYGEEHTVSNIHQPRDVVMEEWKRIPVVTYSCELTLDLNTANRHLRLSEGGTVVTCSNTDQSYPDHPGRFDYWPQALCKEALSGRCYWEVEWSGRDGVFMAVSYEGISRKGRAAESVFGCNRERFQPLPLLTQFQGGVLLDTKGKEEEMGLGLPVAGNPLSAKVKVK
ncbi:hypothetical protein NFI96_002080 [Prochilodus magdalenae]|nr:hypothetical protein NFI96_002080 [Prochilodus magdalenae]